MRRHEQWPRARRGYLYGVALAVSIGGVIALAGAIGGQAFVASDALGAIGLSVAAALIALDTLYPGLACIERHALMGATLASTVVYFAVLGLGAAHDDETMMALAGPLPILAGGISVWLALHRPESRRRRDPQGAQKPPKS